MTDYLEPSQFEYNTTSHNSYISAVCTPCNAKETTCRTAENIGSTNLAVVRDDITVPDHVTPTEGATTTCSYSPHSTSIAQGCFFNSLQGIRRPILCPSCSSLPWRLSATSLPRGLRASMAGKLVTAATATVPRRIATGRVRCL
jgi:hypothetical protein